MSKSKSDVCKCATCQGKICYPRGNNINAPLPPLNEAPGHCPMRRYPDEIRRATGNYHKANIREFARLASIQEAECYGISADGMRTEIPRIEEIVQFAKKCNYTKLGLAFCIGLREEARLTTKIFEAKGFQVSSICCKVGRMPKEIIGIKGEEKITGPDMMEPMCNPVVQAKIMNAEEVDLVVLLGLCVGHDTLFFKYCDRPCTVLAVKDRVTGHNPLAAVYMSKSPYYSRLQTPEPKEESRTGLDWKKVDIMHEE